MRLRKPKWLAAAGLTALVAGAGADTTVVGSQGPSTNSTPYLVPVQAGVRTVSVFTVGETVNKKLDGVTDYKMVGIPDGLGVFDNGDGTFTLTMNHEITTGAPGVTRVHGSTGAFVSVWNIDKKTLKVNSVNDLIKTVETWNAATQSHVQGTTQFARFCSADVPAVSAFYDAATGLGSKERFHMNGEESAPANARAWAHQITGGNAGVTTELPRLGRQSWENIVACPYAQTKTIVACDDDTTPGQVFIYVGTKLASGTEVQKAGLLNGTLYGVLANGKALEDRTTNIGLTKSTPLSPASGAFTLVALPDQSTAAAYGNGGTTSTTEADATAAGATKFLRPEDGAWDPLHPSHYYFVTTDSPLPSGRSRLWRLKFSDITNPTAGGTIEMLLDGTEGGDMYDNITIDRTGHVVLCEDIGGNAKAGKLWEYDIATGALVQVAKHDVARFGDVVNGVTIPATAPFNNDEESSGVIDAQDLLGPGWFLIDVQAHYGIAGELVEGGQLLAVQLPDCIAITIGAVSVEFGTPFKNVAFGVDASIVGDGKLSYSWDFGDGASAAGKDVTHLYQTPGVYDVVVTATHDASGKSALKHVLVDVRGQGAAKK
jgi:hypothetical protein